MKKELDNLLCKRYPKIFRDRHKSPQKTCMCWGFPGDGWFMLIDSLCNSIQARIDNSAVQAAYHKEWHDKYVLGHGKPYTSEWSPFMDQMEPIPQVIALQVKEKFGTLRFYFFGGDDEIHGMVSAAEHMSASICEACGAFSPDVGYTTGWIQVICPICLRKSERPDRPWTKTKSNEQAAKAMKSK